MKELRLEVTDDLMEKIEKEARFCLVSPEHYATCRLSMIFREKKPWGDQILPILAPMLENLAGTLKNFMASQSQPAGNHNKEG